jgi:penicillin-binding protein 1C
MRPHRLLAAGFFKRNKAPFARKFVVRLLCLIFISGIFFILVFAMLCLIFPLPDKIEYSVCIRDDQGQIVHAYMTKDQQWRMKLEAAKLTPLLKNTIL